MSDVALVVAVGPVTPVACRDLIPLMGDVDLDRVLDSGGGMVAMAVASTRTSLGTRDLLEVLRVGFGGCVPEGILKDVRVHAELLRLDSTCADGLADLWRYADAGALLYVLRH